ncbi:spore coat polysaccharide biosynthesis protein SpsF [Desulfurella multipotens]|uniref:Spore coat polysaccharide biosynthesis protein SpsF n=1 Tax=Desulfurella multipotens TaxID=79269 RepID=A0A1G6LHW2_9BACT|nr:glycosyltransferase family protein [Desulfurella multipotens]SDC42774.1 spore coat polysaccharide biosynthesis protein SpsF [Desulfurella multipotens]
MQKTIAIIQARMSSTRLPGKVMLDLAGKPVIWHVYHRALHSKYVSEVIVATSKDKSDDELVEFLKANSMNYYRGSLDNVLERFMDIIYEKKPKYVVRITADCPHICPVWIDNQISALSLFDADVIYCENLGCAFEGAGVIKADVLDYIYKNTNDALNKEHVGAIYITQNPDKLRIVEVCPKDSLILQNCRLTLDEKKDYELYKIIYEKLYTQKYFMYLEDIVNLLKSNPEFININKNIQHKPLNIELQTKYTDIWKNAKKVGKFFWQDNP